MIPRRKNKRKNAKKLNYFLYNELNVIYYIKTNILWKI